MAIPAHWEETAGETPREPRRKLALEAEGALPSGASAGILVHDISATGLLVESTLPLAIDERIAIALPEAGETWAAVVWESGKLFGCRFDAPISAAALSAAQLRGAVRQALAIAPRGAGSGDASFGARLQRLRQLRGVSQTEVANRLGVSKPTVWAWEHDKARPIGERIEDLAHILGVTRSELMDPPGTAHIVARCRKDIGAAFGIDPDKVKVSLEL